NRGRDERAEDQGAHDRGTDWPSHSVDPRGDFGQQTLHVGQEKLWQPQQKNRYPKQTYWKRNSARPATRTMRAACVAAARFPPWFTAQAKPQRLSAWIHARSAGSFTRRPDTTRFSTLRLTVSGPRR